jgi:seryl-tRNA synthetase
MGYVAKLESVAHALLRPSGVDGVYVRTALFEEIIDALSALIGRYREPDTEILRFPPVMSRRQLETSGYLLSFPHLLGCVSTLHGDEAEIRALVERPEWVEGLSATEIVLSPAACYPVYPFVATRGSIPANGLLFDVSSYCFRREPSHEIDRFQSFQMREYVCLGTPEQVLDFRARWLSRAEGLTKELGLSYWIAPASDAFFGRGGRLAALSQLQQSLKLELLVPILSEEKPTACMSFNYHRDHFGSAWSLQTENGDIAHTACVAFGMERLALALFATHGLDAQKWPTLVRKKLDMEKHRA